MPTLNVDYADPGPIRRSWTQLSGREFLELIGEGRIALPPILAVLDITAGAVGDGVIEFAMRPHDYMMNLAGTIHGGVLATLVDSALTCALVTKLPQGMGCVSIDLQMRFFRPARMSSELLTARAEVLNAGKTLGATQGEIRDANGRLIVHATSSLAIAATDSLITER